MKRRTALKHLALMGSAAMLSLHSQRMLAAGQEATAISAQETAPESADRPERRWRPHRRRRYWLRVRYS